MPIYEFLCKECRCRFEHLQLFSSGPAKCPVCGSGDLEQLISASAVHSEGMTQANLSAAHRKAAAARGEKQREDHRHHHEHFEDRPAHSDHVQKPED